MATLNLPAWGYGLRYRYGLFKQQITKVGQEETAEDWLEVRFRGLSDYFLSWMSNVLCYQIMQKFSPWEVVRHDIVYPVRFFGIVEVHPNGT